MKETRDILVLFEALNNHEIFTPPKLAREMLEMLPKDVWTNPSLRFLDPCTKSGVFLREIFYKLYEGLKNKGLHKAHDGLDYDLNDHKQRINHILKNMIYGIATSELTGYVARRTLYGVMDANTDKQVAAIESFAKSDNYHQWSEEEQLKFVSRNRFNEYYNHNMFNTKEYLGFEEEGNVFYPSDEVAKKVLEDGKYEVEDMYFPFINEETKHQKILDIKEGRMKFDVIIGNPPYQVSDGGGTSGNSALPVYNLFIDAARKINPKYISMITPSRWFAGGRGLDKFRKTMLEDKRIKIIHDFPSAKECFPGVEIKGGVNYFLWDSKHSGDCTINTHKNNSIVSSSMRPLLEEGSKIFIRYNQSISILKKIQGKTSEKFIDIVSSNDPFGFDVREKNSYKRVKPKYTLKEDKESVPFYYNGWRKNGVGYIKKEYIRKNLDLIENYKIFVPKAVGSGESESDVIKPFVPLKNAVCTETYLVIWAKSEEELENIISYVDTKFFHFLVTLIKNTQSAYRHVYEFVPMVDFSKKWSDKDLYSQFDLSDKEIDFIEEMVWTKVVKK